MASPCPDRRWLVYEAISKNARSIAGDLFSCRNCMLIVTHYEIYFAQQLQESVICLCNICILILFTHTKITNTWKTARLSLSSLYSLYLVQRTHCNICIGKKRKHLSIVEPSIWSPTFLIIVSISSTTTIVIVIVIVVVHRPSYSYCLPV